MAERIEQALAGNDLSGLTPVERVQLILATCRSIGVNHLTGPFGYIQFKEREDDDTAKLVLYAKADCAFQLSKIHRVTEMAPPKRWSESGFLCAEVYLRDGQGRVKSDIGVVSTQYYSRKDSKWHDMAGTMLANAMMKVGTKAYRRAVLRLCGLGLLDESELDTMQITGGVTPEGRVFSLAGSKPDDALFCQKHNCHISRCPSDEHTTAENEEAERLIREAKLTRAQKEVVERKREEFRARKSGATEAGGAAAGGSTAAAPAPAEPHYEGFFYGPLGADHYVIDGPDQLKQDQRELLKPLWNKQRRAIVADASQLGKLLSQFEKMGVPIRAAQESKAIEGAVG